MLVLRLSSPLTTHKYWTQRTLQLNNNYYCPQQLQYQVHLKIPFKSSSTTTKQQHQQPSNIVRLLSNFEKENQQIHQQQQLANAQFQITVIQKLLFLMNEIRTKKNFSSISNNCSPFTNKYKQQHLLRQHRQVSKSNKVLLRYTRRDPRLRNTINKHSKLSEFLCNYGELIGGDRSEISKKLIRISFSVPSLKSKFSKQLRYGDKLFITNSSFIHGDGKKKKFKNLFKCIY